MSLIQRDKRTQGYDLGVFLKIEKMRFQFLYGYLFQTFHISGGSIGVLRYNRWIIRLGQDRFRIASGLLRDVHIILRKIFLGDLNHVFSRQGIDTGNLIQIILPAFPLRENTHHHLGPWVYVFQFGGIFTFLFQFQALEHLIAKIPLLNTVDLFPY